MNELGIIQWIERLIEKAGRAEKSEDALRYSQAANNAASALRAVTGPVEGLAKRMERAA